MAPRNAIANISFTVDSASEDDMTLDELNPMPTPDSNTENKAPARKARGKAAQPAKAASATKATAKSKPPTRVAETKKETAAAKKAPAKAGRKALAERNKGGDDDAVEADELDENETTEVAEPAKPAKRGRPAKAKKIQEEEPAEEEPAPAPAKRGRKPAAKEPVAKKEPKAKSTAKARSSRRGEESEAEQDTLTIPETQAEPDADSMDVDDSVEVEEIPESMPPPPRPSARPLARRPAAASRTRQPSAAGRRAGSASDTERDPALRRKVGDLTKKLEAMTAKYETLQDVATSGKESNFEQLRRRTEQVSKDQDAVIKALKQQVADLQTRTAEITSLNKTIAALTKTNSSLAAENKKLTDGLNTAQKENTTLNTKLAAARSSTQPDAKVPGSAVKARTTGVVLPGSAEAAKDAMLQKQKVEMYCDLTNLVIVGVKKNEDDEDVYDCLQTGRNGTLHFHLTISEGGESYADTEFVYQPLLDEQRDKDLLDLLPDYLTEEISFPRAHAAKFFSKVVDSMSKRIVLEDEE
ncbi:chromosome segregation protein Csm1/Pcs1-domain-containing protein [Boeremia exigua]|uniref:chromosome segregation protein Csm1/Pcs1-domain-containing protein n=1 Tax=Boeremia exigua TaxID=749465 RepID=UPI001E8D0A65|nr:chromosome segregation protein Csm1/Pcs1-domain-containing protein [Boeremia exigua]KAH6611879.1 chromosome segregation protein Csm1/Pcs1-domain-containing protein [Boeremia exigua]